MKLKTARKLNLLAKYDKLTTNQSKSKAFEVVQGVLDKDAAPLQRLNPVFCKEKRLLPRQSVPQPQGQAVAFTTLLMP